MKIKGNTAIVAGGASGLGEGAVRMLAGEGASVAIFDLNAEKGGALESELAGSGGKVKFYNADVADAAAVELALQAAVKELGAPRILINCAGIAPGQKTAGSKGPHDLDLFRKVIEVNLIGTFNTARLFSAEALKLDPQEGGERGVIVNTTSIAAYEGQMGQAAYSASKGGIAGMNLPIARDLARDGIRCNAVAPGIFLTPLLEGMPEEVQQSLADNIPFPSRLGSPAEYASLLREIITNQMINGEVIRIDGATRLQPR
jgi:NAD(P)-dependent dehydrogenase (short-subunit alcohol dehydrogenase family)